MNLSTAIVLLVLLLVVGLALRTIIHNKRIGKSTCGGNCSGCGGASLCHRPHHFVEEYKKQKQ